MGSPSEQFRNPNTEDEAVGSNAGPVEPAEVPAEEKFDFEKVMTPEEEACYAKRYTDVGSMTPNEHYARVGEKQGRNIRCLPWMTGIAAKRYLRRYWFLGNEYGREGSDAFKGAREHWYANGSKQSPPLQTRISQESENPYKCSDHGQDCTCAGRIHFGYKTRPDNGADITTLEDLMDWNKKTKWEEGYQLKINCDRHAFKKGKSWDGIPDDNLQCFCEPFLQPQPYHCSADGGDCKCPGGNVFYGNKFVDGTKNIATFQEMLNPGTYLVAGQIHDTIKCEPKSFVGGEIYDNINEQECYCDDQGFVDITYITSEISWWTSQVEERRAMEMQARIDAEAEAARMQAAADTAALERELAAAEARIRAAEQQYAQAQAAAKQQAEERAAQDKAAAEARAKAAAEREKQLLAQRAQREADHQAALKAAEAAATAAAKETAAAERRKLLEEAERAKEAAIKAQVAAALAAQQEENERVLAEQ